MSVIALLLCSSVLAGQQSQLLSAMLKENTGQLEPAALFQQSKRLA